MALLNIAVRTTAYLDQMKTKNPLVRLADIQFSMDGMTTDLTKQIPISLAPGESFTSASTARTLSFNGSTSFSIVRVANTNYARLTGAYGMRTNRASGSGTTTWAVSLTNTTARLTYTGTGTAPTFGGMAVGDGLTIERDSAFNSLNWGDYVITAVGADYVEFFHPTAVAESIAAAVAIYSSGPVQVGDVLDLQATQFKTVNRGQFPITRVTGTYVEFVNTNAIDESAITGVTTNLAIYSGTYNWVLAAVDQKVAVRFNGDAGSTVEVEPYSPGDLTNNPGLLLKRGRVYQLDVVNLSQSAVNGFVFLTF